MPESPQAETTPEVDLSNPRVLIVDDNEHNLELIQAFLDDLRGELRAARDGSEALEIVREWTPDIVLLDIMMPRMSGYQVCEHIKANPNTSGIPIVMVTALNEVGDVERAVDAGADDFLTKPVNKLELITRVKSLLRVRRLKLQLDAAIDEVRSLRDQTDA